MWKQLVVAMVLLAMGALGAPAAVHAKGPGDVIIGGGDLAPYYYTIQGSQPEGLGWLGLLAAPNGGVPSLSPPPADADTLLATSYELSFDGGLTRPAASAPSARYVPRSAGRSAYLYYEEMDTGLPYGWYVLGDEAVRYLDRARDTALRAKGGDGIGLETDPIDAFIRHGRYFTGLEGTPSIVSSEYDVTMNAEFMNGAAPLHRVTGDDAPRLLDAYIATLHNWHPITYDAAGDYHAFPPGSGKSWEYSIFTPEGRQVFSIEVAADGFIMRVYAAEGFGGYFDPAPALNSLFARVIPRQAPAPGAQTGSGQSSHEASKSAGVVAGALAAGLLLALGIGAVWARRTGRSAPA